MDIWIDRYGQIDESLSFFVGTLKKDEARFQFIQEKYKEMKYSSSANKNRIEAESEPSHDSHMINVYIYIFRGG